ncbi:MAG: dihydrodipicolinate synthase family protein, partial [Antricoccus sp.]
MNPIFTGVGVALITVFHDDLRVDIEATTKLAIRLVGEGISSILIGGTTGEAATLSTSERAQLVASISAATDVPVIAGTGAPSGAQAAEQTAACIESGAAAVLVLSPPRVPDPRAYYAAVAAVAGQTPMLAYHFPLQSPPGIEVDMLAQLPIVGLKDSSGDANRLLHEVATYDGLIYPGAPSLSLMAGALGLPGVLLAIANAKPQEAIAA